jgi:trehalose 6-phosphate synthase
MTRLARFLIPLLLLLGLLSVAAHTVAMDTARRWWLRDLALRSDLAVFGAREALVTYFQKTDRAGIERLLQDLARDVRIMSAAACDGRMRTLVVTPGFPNSLRCEALRDMGAGQSASAWHRVVPVKDGDVHISVISLIPHGVTGSVVLLHDMDYAERRESTMGTILILAFLALAVCASGATVLVVRLSWRSFSEEMQRLVRAGDMGATARPEFLPILRDVRDLVERLRDESEAEGEAGGWTPERLRQTIQRQLRGETVLVVANREPYIHERTEAGEVRVVYPASGLVTALEPVMRACSGVWIAHGGGSADRETVDQHDRVRVPPGEEAYQLRRVWLSEADERGYYYGFANGGLWPLCHVAHVRPQFRHEDFAAYERVNRLFADAAQVEAGAGDPIVFVQDYHFGLAPKMIHERLPNAVILTFWHIPFPNAERFGICPYHREILDGMLGSSILGFHTQLHCNNFLEAVDRFLEARIDREENAVIYRGHVTLVRPYPISIEWPSRWLAGAPSVAECRAQVRRELDLPEDALLGVGVDRLDYTKGIEERLLSVERALVNFPALRGRFTFVQLAAPSRTALPEYRALNDRVEEIAARINERFGQGRYRPVILLRRHHEPPSVFRFYRAAEVCYVSSLHDGMNLVAKEFVSARDDERGALVLSRFTGASRELTEALLVNPYDLDEAAAALHAALSMPPAEQAERMRSMRRFVREFNVYRWAGRMLTDAARLRQRERLSGRLSDPRMRALGDAA